MPTTFFRLVAAIMLCAGSAGLCCAEDLRKANEAQSFQLAQERVAQNVTKSGEVLQPIPIFLRNADIVASGWTSWFGAGGRGHSDIRTVDVVARLKSGEEVVIDRVDEVNADSIPTISDQSGAIVGYFHQWQSQEGSWKSGRAEFALYFASEQNLIKRTGEMRCQKIGNQGSPSLSFANASWDGNSREVQFDVHSNCYHINLHGGRSGNRTLNLVEGNFHYNASSGTSYEYVDQSQRLVIAIDSVGNLEDYEVAKDSAAERKAFRSCLAERSSNNFRVCETASGDQRLAFWRSGGKTIEFNSECTQVTTSAVSSNAEQLAVACNWRFGENDKMHALRLEIASVAAPLPIAVTLSCTCSSLEAIRLHFDSMGRTLTFNLDTDAETVEFEGDELKIAAGTAVEGAAVSKLAVQIFSVRFNENWQVVEIASDGKALEGSLKPINAPQANTSSAPAP